MRQLALLILCSVCLWSADQALLAFEPAVVDKRVKPSDAAQVAVAVQGKGAKRTLQVACKAGAPGYPGVAIAPPGDSWSLAETGHVEVQVKNTGEKSIDLALRVDNAGDWKQSPWNTEHVGIKPGESKALRVRYGYSFGQPAFALDPKRVTQVLIFVTAASVGQVFEIESLTAGGKPGEKP